MIDNAPPPLAPLLHDQWGRAYVPLNPMPGVVSVPLQVLEVIELWRLSVHAAAWCARHSQSERWAYHEEQARLFLATTRDLDPLVSRMYEDPPHYGTQGAV